LKDLYHSGARILTGLFIAVPAAAITAGQIYGLPLPSSPIAPLDARFCPAILDVAELANEFEALA
jgi:hypothetical protein